MNLYFMRHGIAADRADGGVKTDGERPLTPKGIKKMQKAAKGVAALSLSFDRILSSPLERARQTAKIVAQTLKLEDRSEEIEQLCPDERKSGSPLGVDAQAAAPASALNRSWLSNHRERKESCAESVDEDLSRRS
ncbi:MAG TPA: histidine phosphatase family protein [Candidatus Binatia bacterium]|nr:histidine phosphatase family protein [Candidatus Binatia bacterium]